MLALILFLLLRPIGLQPIGPEPIHHPQPVVRPPHPRRF